MTTVVIYVHEVAPDWVRDQVCKHSVGYLEAMVRGVALQVVIRMDAQCKEVRASVLN